VNALTRIAVGALGGIRWLLLAVGTAAVTLAAQAKRTADWLLAMPGPAGTFAAFKAQHLLAMREAAMSGSKTLATAFTDLPNGPHKEAFRAAFWASLEAEAAAVDAEVSASAKGQAAKARAAAEQLRP